MKKKRRQSKKWFGIEIFKKRKLISFKLVKEASKLDAYRDAELLQFALSGTRTKVDLLYDPNE